MKKTFFRVLVASIVLGSLAYSLPFTNNSYNSSSEEDNYNYNYVNDDDLNNIINNNLVLANYQQSLALLEASKSLMALSTQLLDNHAKSSPGYINAMLRLSDDIGSMADKIGEMSDRIVSSELQIGVMTDKFLDAQKKQDNNTALTQANILKAQETFEKILKGFGSTD